MGINLYFVTIVGADLYRPLIFKAVMTVGMGSNDWSMNSLFSLVLILDFWFGLFIIQVSLIKRELRVNSLNH